LAEFQKNKAILINDTLQSLILFKMQQASFLCNENKITAALLEDNPDSTTGGIIYCYSCSIFALIYYALRIFFIACTSHNHGLIQQLSGTEQRDVKTNL